jgi:hypothetical protein
MAQYIINPYKGAALESYEKITEGLTSYATGKIYVNVKYGIFFYINQKHFLHVLKLTRESFDGKYYYSVNDWMLTKDNTLEDRQAYFRGSLKECKEFLRTAEQFNGKIETEV